MWSTPVRPILWFPIGQPQWNVPPPFPIPPPPSAPVPGNREGQEAPAREDAILPLPPPPQPPILPPPPQNVPQPENLPASPNSPPPAQQQNLPLPNFARANEALPPQLFQPRQIVNGTAIELPVRNFFCLKIFILNNLVQRRSNIWLAILLKDFSI